MPANFIPVKSQRRPSEPIGSRESKREKQNEGKSFYTGHDWLIRVRKLFHLRTFDSKASSLVAWTLNRPMKKKFACHWSLSYTVFSMLNCINPSIGVNIFSMIAMNKNLVSWSKSRFYRIIWFILLYKLYSNITHMDHF